MTADEYIEKRVEDQIQWYDAKAKSSQKAFRVLRAFEIILAASIPLLSGFVNDFHNINIKTLIGIMGVIITIIAGLLSLFQFQENWVQYRATCEALKNEKFLFLAQAAPYDTRNAFILLVQRVEALLSKETSVWSERAVTSGKSGQTSND